MKPETIAVIAEYFKPSDKLLLRALNAISSVAYWCGAQSGRVLFLTYAKCSSVALRAPSLLMFRDIHILRLVVYGLRLRLNVKQENYSEYGRIAQIELPALLDRMEYLANAALTGAEGVRVEGTVMQQTED